MNALGILIVLLLLSVPALAQPPDFSWGAPIKRDPMRLQHMHMVGVDSDGFFTTFAQKGQVTLEHYDPQSQRLWTTALLPRTPAGEHARFHSVQMFQGRLYLISIHTENSQTQVYAQEIKHNGNYSPDITPLAKGKVGRHLHVTAAGRGTALNVVLCGDSRQAITSALLNNKLHPRWQQTLTSEGQVQQVHVKSDGTTFLLTRSPAAAPATAAFYLHRLDAGTGIRQELPLGDAAFRPLQAQIAETATGDILVTGYMVPASSVASQKPEPVGTFYYRFAKGRLRKPTVAYTPFQADFIHAYKRAKPDYDYSQRLRHLQLNQVLPLADKGAILVGEVAYTEQLAHAPFFHNNDVIVIRLRHDGSTAYATSVNKTQGSHDSLAQLRSYFVTSLHDTLQLLYLDFAYKFSTEDKLLTANSKAITRTPVLVTVLPGGRQIRRLLSNTRASRQQPFYLRPSSVYPLSHREFIILGIGPGYYRYGQMRF